MTDLTMGTIDPLDPQAFDRWHEVYFAADKHGRAEYAATWQREEARALFAGVGTASRNVAYTGTLDGEVVTVGWLQANLQDNLTMACVQVYTHPDHRGRGYASQLLSLLEADCLADGRTTAIAEVGWAYDLGTQGHGSRDVAFARKHGYDLALPDVMRQLTLPTAPGLLDDLIAQAAAYHPGYRIVTWVGPVPDEYVATIAALEATIDLEAPSGDLELEEYTADVGVFRAGEAVKRAQQRTSYWCIAVDADNTPVAYTELVASVHEGARAFQWGTLVAAAHRGHRLGLAIKAANCQQLERLRPDLARIATYNAEVNDHMIGVNEAMGFVPVERLGEFQRKLA